jgi:hypothetical protein
MMLARLVRLAPSGTIAVRYMYMGTEDMTGSTIGI